MPFYVHETLFFQIDLDASFDASTKRFELQPDRSKKKVHFASTKHAKKMKNRIGRLHMPVSFQAAWIVNFQSGRFTYTRQHVFSESVISRRQDEFFGSDDSAVVACQLTSLPADPLTGLPTDRLTGLPACRLTGLYRLTSLPAYRLTGLPADRLTGLPADRLTGLPAYRLTGLPADRLTGLPADRLTGLPAYRLTG